ncbi:MAG: DUF86 domain-containing protein [Synergistaceae bacterium]|nr:DUF86 domain-containing protein [Synergistaceae bacterium]
MPKYDKRISILERIIRYCEQIDKTTERFGKSYEIFYEDFDYQNASAMCIFQIGELASRLPGDFHTEYNKVPWKLICGMRNIFAHEYERMDIEELWKTIETDIPTLKEYCKEVLRDITNNGAKT